MSVFPWLPNLEKKRKRLLKRAPEGPLRDFLAVPFPDPKTPINELDLLAVDFETTGLDPVNDKLLSVGMVDIKRLQIPLGTSFHQIIRTEAPLKAENVIIHQITDDAKDAGAALTQVVERLLEQLAGKAMLAHYHRIEHEFLNQACLLLYNAPIIFPIVDTLMIQKQQWDKGLLPYNPSQLRLSNLRDHYKLPHHKAHNALTDAIATAELFLAQQATYNFDDLKDVRAGKL